MKKLVKESLNEFELLSNSKRGFFTDIEKDTIENRDFRKVLYTGEHIQLVLMTLEPGEDIGMEVHSVDQFFRFEKGSGKVIINKSEYKVKDGSSVIIPSGAEHNVINTGGNSLHMYTLYAPPHHEIGTIHATKEEAEMSDEEWQGKTTE